MAGGRRIGLAFVAAALVCAGSAAAAGTWPKHEKNAADQALAAKSILHLSDFTPGTGWKVAHDGGDSGGTMDDPACKGAQFSDVGRVLTGSASSTFEAPGLQVWSSADVMKTLAMARTDVGKMTRAAIVPCLAAVIRNNLPKTVRLRSVDALSFPRVGDWTSAYRVVIDVTVSSTTVRMQLDVVLVQHDRVEITLMQMAPSSISSLAKAGELRMAQRLAGPSLSA